jgi:hypothetical protein
MYGLQITVLAEISDAQKEQVLCGKFTFQNNLIRKNYCQLYGVKNRIVTITKKGFFG